MENEPTIEWIGPKILVIVRIPQTYTDNMLLELAENLKGIKDYTFVVARDETINRVEFEYPKNYRSFEDKPEVTISKYNPLTDIIKFD